ncbi:MAG: tripartite tricarboxylate transporter substrate binding protein, partial [Angelakisella sp.]
TEQWKNYTEENCLDRLYESYSDTAAIEAFYKNWESTVSWLIYDAGAAKISPEELGIPRL